MMSLFFSLAGLVILSYFNSIYFWYSVGVMLLMMSLFIIMNFMFVDFSFYFLGLSLDVFSLSLIILSFFISGLMLLASNSIFGTSGSSVFYLLVYILFFVLVVTFLVNSMLVFYFFFEFSLIPTLLIILGWGYQPERLQAGIYFLFYTLAASLPLLLVFIYNFYNEGNFIYLLMFDYHLSYSFFILFLFSILAFLVKMPMFLVHLWLPKAHVEAPVSGSMILAGVLLKLGGYGMFRVLSLAKSGLLNYGCYFFGLSIMGMVYVGFMCCRLSDLKALVAYSSVSHMGLVICGFMSFYYWGLEGSLMMMISHGLASSGLFCAVNMFYERSGSRGFFLNKGMISIFPLMSLMFFLLCGANMAAPPTINLLSEIFLMGGMMKYDFFMIMFFPLGSYLGALFTLYLFSYSQHGKFVESIFSLSYVKFREVHSLGMHLIPLNIFFLNMDFFLWFI